MIRLFHRLSAAALGGKSGRMGIRGRAAVVTHRRQSFTPLLEALEQRQLMAFDSILSWNSVMLQANANDHALDHPEQGGPVLTWPAFAIVSGAMSDVYNSVKHTGTPFRVTPPPSGKTNEDAAVAQAAHDTLVAFYPSKKAMFDRALNFSMLIIPNGPAETRGRDVGRFVAQEIL